MKAFFDSALMRYCINVLAVIFAVIAWALSGAWAIAACIVSIVFSLLCFERVQRYLIRFHEYYLLWRRHGISRRTSFYMAWKYS